jgi:3',5'-cyclic AMP phosphodiesterase CpdA
MTRLLQVSDPHFGTERAAVVESVVRLARSLQPELVVLSGDITQRARESQFRAARAFVERLGAPVLTVPGNHDLPLFDLVRRLVQPYARLLRHFGPGLEPAHASPGLLVLGLNTTRATRHKNGVVSDEQIERIARRLAAAQPGQLRIVVVHQPVAVTRPEDVSNLLIHHERALPRWAEAGADLVMGGHIHLPYVLPVTGLARPVWAVQAGTAVSRRVRNGVPNSVNVLRWGEDDAPPGQCLVERWDYDDTAQVFVRHSIEALRPERRRSGRDTAG